MVFSRDSCCIIKSVVGGVATNVRGFCLLDIVFMATLCLRTNVTWGFITGHYRDLEYICMGCLILKENMQLTVCVL